MKDGLLPVNAWLCTDIGRHEAARQCQAPGSAVLHTYHHRENSDRPVFPGGVDNLIDVWQPIITDDNWR